MCQTCRQRRPLESFQPIGGGRRRGTCRRCKNAKGKNQQIAAEVSKRFHRPLDSKRYIITAAQNATPVHAEFLAALKVAAKHLSAELVVIPLRYKNPTSQWTQKQQDHEWWGLSPWQERYEKNLITPHLFNQRKKLNANLVLAADIKTQPTASSPLTGFESLTGAESCIIGHPKMQFRTVPVPIGRFPKILTTTGVCTKRNYTDTKTGKIGAFHHFLGALIVEIQGSKFHLRQLNADQSDGSFIDLDKKYTPQGVSDAPPALGLAIGDTHAGFGCPLVDRATYGAGGIIDNLKPEVLIFHDVLDGYSINPHHQGNPFIAQAKYLSGRGDVASEVRRCVQFVKERAKGRPAVLVASNHNDFLSRWILRDDWKRDPVNADFYLETARAMLSTVRMGPGGTEYADAFCYWVNKLKGDADIRCLGSDESFKVGDVECGQHGHQGPNGARGTLKNLARLGSRVISGHTHTPGIEEGHYQLGTSTPLRLEYTHGPSSWLNAHAVIYANGKRALLTIIEGNWRIP